MITQITCPILEPEVAELFFQKGANFSAVLPDYYNTVLNWAAQMGNYQTIQFFSIPKSVKKYSNFNFNNVFLLVGHDEIVELLIQKDADLNFVRDEENVYYSDKDVTAITKKNPALALAALNGDEKEADSKIVSMLISEHVSSIVLN